MPTVSRSISLTAGRRTARFVLFSVLPMVFACRSSCTARGRAPTDAGVDLPVAALQFIAPLPGAMTLVVRDG